MPRAPGVSRQVLAGTLTDGLMMLACSHISSRKNASFPAALASEGRRRQWKRKHSRKTAPDAMMKGKRRKGVRRESQN